MSTPPQDPNQPQDPNRKPNDDGDQGQPERPQYGEQDRPQYGQPQYGEQGLPQYGQPQYGSQNQPGQSPYGSQNPGAQSPYGYQSAQPSAYGYPSGQAQFQQPGPVFRPKEVEISFWLIIAAAVLTAITTIISLATLGSPAMMEQFEAVMGQQGGEVPMDTDAFVGMIATFAVIIGIIGIAIYLLIAFMVRKGKNWARITATILAALSLLTLIGSSFVWIITVLCGVAAVVLLYMPKSSNYFNAVKAQKYGAYGR